MIARRTLDVSSLPPYAVSADAPLWWGQVFLAAIEGTMFSILLAMYCYIRLSVDAWPPPGIRMPHHFLPVLSVALLIASCIGSYLASEGSKQGSPRAMVFGLVLNLALGCAAMGVRAIEWNSWNFTWTSTAYGSIVWAILFLHTLDCVLDLLFTLVLALIISRGNYGPRQRLGVYVDSVIWYFLVAIWAPLYIAVYWGPYFVGTPR
jgi:cytochrome c oxidase subunit I+III